MKTVVRQVILVLLMRMKRVMLQVILLQLLWMRGELQVQPSNCHVMKFVESHTSTQVPFVPLFRACIVGRNREVPQPFHLGGAVSVSVTTPIESPGNLSPRLKDSISGEDNTTYTQMVRVTATPCPILLWLLFPRKM